MQMSGKQPLAKKEKTLTEESFFLIERTVPGIDLLSPLQSEVPSACASLTALFGMGRPARGTMLCNRVADEHP